MNTITISQLRSVNTASLRALLAPGEKVDIVPWMGESPVAVLMPYEGFLRMQQALEMAMLLAKDHPLRHELMAAIQKVGGIVLEPEKPHAETC